MNCVANRDGNNVLDYKDVQGIDDWPNTTQVDGRQQQGKETVYNFVGKFVSKIYGNCSINKWVSKRKGKFLFDIGYWSTHT